MTVLSVFSARLPSLCAYLHPKLNCFSNANTEHIAYRLRTYFYVSSELKGWSQHNINNDNNKCSVPLLDDPPSHVSLCCACFSGLRSICNYWYSWWINGIISLLNSKRRGKSVMHETVQRQICKTGWRNRTWVDVIWTVCYLFCIHLSRLQETKTVISNRQQNMWIGLRENTDSKHYSENNSCRWWQHAPHNVAAKTAALARPRTFHPELIPRSPSTCGPPPPRRRPSVNAE